MGLGAAGQWRKTRDTYRPERQQYNERPPFLPNVPDVLDHW